MPVGQLVPLTHWTCANGLYWKHQLLMGMFYQLDDVAYMWHESFVHIIYIHVGSPLCTIIGAYKIHFVFVIHFFLDEFSYLENLHEYKAKLMWRWQGTLAMHSYCTVLVLRLTDWELSMTRVNSVRLLGATWNTHSMLVHTLWPSH